MSERALDIARMIFEAEPEAAVGEPAAVERVTVMLAKVTGAVLSSVLVRQGDEAFAEALGRVNEAIEKEARGTASLAIALMEGDDPPTSLN